MHESLFARGGLSLERLQTFCAIVHARGITAAAGDDPGRQGQFSRQLRELERFFGTELVERGRGELRPTADGEQLLRIASTALSGLEEMLAATLKKPARLLIGAGESLIQWWLLPRLPKFGPVGITPSFENLRNRDIARRLLDGSIDLGIVTRDVKEPRLASKALGRIEYRCFASRNFLPSTARDRIPSGTPFAELLGAPRIASALASERRRLKDPAEAVLRLSSYPQLAAAVASGRAAAILPHFAASQFPPTADVRSIRPKFLRPLDDTMRLLWNPAMLDVRPAIARALPLLTGAWSER